MDSKKKRKKKHDLLICHRSDVQVMAISNVARTTPSWAFTSLRYEMPCTFHSHFPAIWYLLLDSNLTGSYGDYTVLCMHDVGRLFMVIYILIKVSFVYFQCKTDFYRYGVHLLL